MKTLTLLATAVSIVALSACGGSSSTGSPSTSSSSSSSSSTSSSGGQFKQTVATKAKLRQATPTELEMHLKNGVNYHTIDTLMVVDFAEANSTDEVVAEVGDASRASDDGSDSGGFSSTNTFVDGVDEGDYLKYDGQYLYSLQASTSSDYQTTLRVVATDPENATASEVSNVELGTGNIPDLFLVENNQSEASDVLALYTTWNSYYVSQPLETEQGTEITLEWPTFTSSSVVTAKLFDLTNVATPELDFTLEIDGNLRASRKIDNYLYLVIDHDVSYGFINVLERQNDTGDASSSTVNGASPEILDSDIGLNDLLPYVSINGNTPTPLLDDDACFIQEDVTALHGYHQLLSVVVVDLAQQNLASTSCINAPFSGIYMTPSNLYVGANSHYFSQLDAPTVSLDVEATQATSDDVIFDGPYSVVHQFAIDGANIEYQATGAVEGSVTWSQAGFFVSERGDYLRVISSNHFIDEHQHKLTVLKNIGEDELVQVAQIPNAEQPAAIGKPQEEIYGARFIDNRAYIVTFMRTDPLYVINLSDNEAPYIEGELEVPGFSSYLHPIGENYLLGVGYDVDPSSPWATRSGVKVSLYDVTQPANPTELNNYILGGQGSYTPATHELHALNFLQTNDDTLRFTFPVHLSESYEWQASHLELFEVNNITASASLSHAGSLNANGGNFPEYNWTDRAFMHGDAVYYSNNGNIWSAFWQSPSQANGPQ